MASLTSLNLNNNNIGAEGVRALLDGWLNNPNAHRLQTLRLGANNTKGLPLPAETLSSGNAQQILAAWRTFRAAEKAKRLRPLDEAKLLVVGAEAVGKTSLVRYLVENQPRNVDEKKTEGIARVSVAADQLLRGAGNTRINIWDFGGQEIMYGTHRFFLTKRSLYLLVLEDRREDDKTIYDWLPVIAKRAGDAPIIVVINKSDNNEQKLLLEENKLKRDHPQIVGFVRTSCEDNNFSRETIQALRELIVKTLLEHPALQEIRDSFAPSYLWVKKQVAEKAANKKVLYPLDFERIFNTLPDRERIEQTDLQSTKERRGLLRLLHDLGVIVAHGLEEDASDTEIKIVLLEPNWLTQAIYTILNHNELKDRQGVFHQDRLKEWLDTEEYSPNHHKYILEMMQKEDLGLCFPVPDSPGEFLVPESLPVEWSDASQFWAGDCLRFRYRYSLVPRELIPRLIVRAHDKLGNKPICWRAGAQFWYEGCHVLVEADRDKKVVEIGVTGNGSRRSALNVIRSDLERIHGLLGELGVKAFVPLPDNPEVDEDYEHLLWLENKEGKEHSYYPRGAKRKYTVRELLDGVRMEPQREKDMPTEKGHPNLSVIFNGPTTFHGPATVGAKMGDHTENNQVQGGQINGGISEGNVVLGSNNTITSPSAEKPKDNAANTKTTPPAAEKPKDNAANTKTTPPAEEKPTGEGLVSKIASMVGTMLGSMAKKFFS